MNGADTIPPGPMAVVLTAAVVWALLRRSGTGRQGGWLAGSHSGVCRYCGRGARLDGLRRTWRWLVAGVFVVVGLAYLDDLDLETTPATNPTPTTTTVPATPEATP